MRITRKRSQTEFPACLIPEWDLAGPVLLGWSPRRGRPGLASGLYDTLQDHLRQAGREARVAALAAGTRGYDFVRAPSMRDIWLRDFCGLPARDETGRPCVCKFRYRPSYLSPAEAKAGDAAGRELAAALGLLVRDVPLVLDGGNFTHDGAGTAIVTNRILADNKPKSAPEIRELLRLHCGIHRLILVPEEPGDSTGHVDGMVRFLGPGLVAVGFYPDAYPEGKTFMDGLAETLVVELGPGYRIVRVPNDEPEDVCTDGIASAAGNRVNFLRVGDLCLVPGYGTPGDRGAAETLRDAMPHLDVRLVSGCTELARAGGVLNCISWGIPLARSGAA